MRRWIDPLLDARGATDADVAAGNQIIVLHHLCSIPHRKIRLARGEHCRDEQNAEHLHNEPRGEQPDTDDADYSYDAWAMATGSRWRSRTA